MNDTDIVADLRECAAESRDLEGDYYADQFATAPEIFERAADEIERLRDAIRRFAEELEKVRGYRQLLEADLSIATLAATRNGNLSACETVRLRLTDAEREAVEAAIAYMAPVGNYDSRVQATLRGLLERIG